MLQPSTGTTARDAARVMCCSLNKEKCRQLERYLTNFLPMQLPPPPGFRPPLGQQLPAPPGFRPPPMQQPGAPYGAPAGLPPPPMMPAYRPQPPPLAQPAYASQPTPLPQPAPAYVPQPVPIAQLAPAYEAAPAPQAYLSLAFIPFQLALHGRRREQPSHACAADWNLKHFCTCRALDSQPHICQLLLGLLCTLLQCHRAISVAGSTTR